MAISAASTITSGGKTWPNGITFSNANIKTITGNWTITGALTISAATTITSASTITCGGLSLTSATTTSGTCEIILSGGTCAGSGTMQCNLTFAGNVTVSAGTFNYNTGTLKWSSGTITTTGSTLAIGASTTLNTSPISWNAIIIGTAGSTITINSLLTATTLTINNGIAIIFAGTSGFRVGTFTISENAARTHTFKNGVTYTITTAFNCFQSKMSTIVLITSDDATLKAIITLNQGATCNVLANFTRIDASAGRPILSFNGTITTCTNVFAYTDVQSPPSAFSRHFGRRKLIYNMAKTVVYQTPNDAT